MKVPFELQQHMLAKYLAGIGCRQPTLHDRQENARFASARFAF
jgi:hypothetical protein